MCSRNLNAFATPRAWFSRDGNGREVTFLFWYGLHKVVQLQPRSIRISCDSTSSPIISLLKSYPYMPIGYHNYTPLYSL